MSRSDFVPKGLLEGSLAIYFQVSFGENDPSRRVRHDRV
jgi:hypothetical protein